MAEQIIVTMTHVRAAGLCSRGAKQWFARNGLDFRTFLTEGYPVEVIEGTQDALGLKVAALTRQMHAEGDGEQ